MGHDVIAPWMSFLLTNPFRRRGQDPRRILAPYLREGMVAVDVGCGPGYFAIPMAEMVGEAGKVVAIDMQETMLRKAREAAQKRGVAGRIDFCQCLPSSLGIAVLADFILAFAVLHEMPDAAAALGEIAAALKPGGRFLLSEPSFHVFAPEFAATLKLAEDAGLQLIDEPRIRMGRSALFAREA